MISIDTNVVLRLLLGDQPSQTEKIIALIDKAKPGSIMIADAVFFEMVWVLSGKPYDLDRALIGKLLRQLMTIPQLNCNRNLLEQAIPRYLAHLDISFIDACLATYAELNQATPLLTLDKRLISALPKVATSF